MDFHSLKAFTEEWAKQAGMSDVMHRGAELLSGSAAKRMANSVKLHGEAAKSLAAKGSTTANLHREAGGIAAKRLATEAEKVTQARIGAGAGLAGGAYGVHKATEEPKTAAELTSEARADLPKKDFAVSAKKSNTGAPSYPVENRQHAASALGFAKMHGDSADLAAVRAKIKAKYPDMLKSAMSPLVMRAFVKEAGGLLGRLASEAGSHQMDLAGLGILAAPSIDEAQAHIRAGLAGDKTPGAVERRTVLPSAAKPAVELGGLATLAVPSALHLMGHGH
jgi:hypothetical protein